ncbi:MAG: carbamoyltransferase N-terminal domain-containing protein, partial [Elusimicrobiota bacterium]
GISAFYHDSAAALEIDGEVVAAAQEERFSRKKHDDGFPIRAVAYCLQEAGIGLGDLDSIVYYDKPLLTFDRLLETYLAFAPKGFKSFLSAMPVWVHEKLNLPSQMDKALGGEYPGEFKFCVHHLSHAASAFYPSPFKSAAILTIDGVGEWSTTTMGVGRGNKIELNKEIRFPQSLGLLYSAFTYYLGFRVNSGEYKVMGLAPYGEPRFYDKIVENLIDIKEDGSFWLDMRYFDYCHGLRMTSEAFHELFEGEPRTAEGKLTRRDMDIAASLQKVTNEIMIRLARTARKETGEENLCMAGGVALNCVANGLILKEKIFKNIFIQPAAGDAGGALGAALFGYHHLLEGPRDPGPKDSMKGALLGPKFGKEDILKDLAASGVKWRELEPESFYDQVCDWLEQGKVIGVLNGRMEFGPRALGSRSIIGDARNREMQSKMNLKIKFRESFRPFAPAVLASDVQDWFELDCESPYMLLVAPVKEEHRLPVPEGTDALEGIAKLKVIRSKVPA